MIEDKPKPAVLFDGACPLCMREIAFYRRLRGAENLSWIDVSAADSPQVCGVDKRDALARFHIVMPDGRPVSGAAAFMQVWRNLPAFRPLAVAFSFPGGTWLLERAYRGFLRIRPAIQRLLPPARG